MCSFLRWKAIQDAAFIDPDDGLKKCWSESHVSEDFDQALRLQMKGWSLRWASYSNGGFQEGVSLTADDEVSLISAAVDVILTSSSTDGRSTHTAVRSFFSNPSDDGSPTVQSLRCFTDSSGPTVSPCTLRSRCWHTSRREYRETCRSACADRQVLRHCLCLGLVAVELGACRSVRRPARPLLPRVLAGVLDVYRHFLGSFQHLIGHLHVPFERRLSGQCARQQLQSELPRVSFF